ncbi:MAG: hypothetical protein M1819_003156 [Sarea resinae]|nr:MAG: hypothetical protein M1819_003156 [Sarea resinae]
MSTKKLSPTANLLRNSRLFSLPPPLPRPSHDLASTYTAVFASDTATLPYPTHAAITTPQSSLSRGDWGLKRPLPLRSTANTSTPTVRIGAIDTLEHITDFESAADHVLTLIKWQEMNIPLTVPRRTRGASGRDYSPLQTSVFEQARDSTETTTRQGSQFDLRWKFKGPWLAGFTEGEFKEYVEKEIRRRKPEFIKYLRTQASLRKTAEKRRQAVEGGESSPTLESSVSVSDEEFQDYIRTLRNDMSSTSTLSSLINNFLDLPVTPAQKQSAYSFLDGSNVGVLNESAPPKTHPSAGLSYLRTASHISNHPVLGPQANPPPVRARILEPRKSATGSSNRAKFGVGGVVTDDGMQASFREDRLRGRGGVPGLSNFDPTIPGGAKIWVHPNSASIDPQGRIKLSIDRASDTSAQIKEGKLAEMERPNTVPHMPGRRMESLSRSRPNRSSGHTYGLEKLFGNGEAKSRNGRGLQQQRGQNGEHDVEAAYKRLADMANNLK